MATKRLANLTRTESEVGFASKKRFRWGDAELALFETECHVHGLIFWGIRVAGSRTANLGRDAECETLTVGLVVRVVGVRIIGEALHPNVIRLNYCR